MNKDEAIHKALKVLNCLNNDRVYETAWVKGAINACEEALEQPEFDYNTVFSHGYETHKSEREYPTKEEMLDIIFKATYQQHNSVKLLHQNEGSITFSNPTADWVMRITSDRKIEVNEDVEVTEAAQKVLDAMQPLLDKQQPEGKEFFERGKEIARWADKQAQEPVGWFQYSDYQGYSQVQEEYKNDADVVPLFTHPHQWQGLTDDEVHDIKAKAIIGAKGMSAEQLLWFIVSLTEQALKEKNNG
jgi:hypothetical protein